MLSDPDGVFTTLPAFLKFRLPTEHNVLSGARLVVFDMVLHGVTSLLEVKGEKDSLELNIILLKEHN